jgi:hypothetical protein
VSEWISVKDKLPDCGDVKDENLGWLVYRPKATSKIFLTTFVHPSWWKDENGTSAEITHWMPLPEPPEPKP